MSAPLVLLGFDAGDGELVSKWAAEGHLPTMRSLMERGWHAKITGDELVCEHGVWTSIVSGAARREHGFHMFRQLKPGTYELWPRTGLDIGCIPFWAKLPGKRVAVIDIPDSFVVPGIPGIQICNWAVHATIFSEPAFHPPDLETKCRRVFGERVVVREAPSASLDQDRKILRKLHERIHKKNELLESLLRGKNFDVIAVSFGEAHTAGHQFRSRTSGDLAGGILEIYKAVDAAYARILDSLPSKANVVLICSNGMYDVWPCEDITAGLLRNTGYQVSPPVVDTRSMDPMTLIRRLIPQAARNKLSALLPTSMQERLVCDKFSKSCDWSRTRAFAVPSWYTGMIRVNLRGREPQGTVEAGAEYRTLLGEIEREFLRLTDPETGKPLVERCLRTVDAFGPKIPQQLPDLFVRYAPQQRFIKVARHPSRDIRQGTPVFFRGSEHTEEAFIAAAGPAFSKRGPQPDIDLLAVAPMLRSLAEHARIEQSATAVEA